MRQALAVTLMNLKSIGNRLGSSLVIVVGIAFVVGVLIGMLSMSKGFERTLRGTGSDSRTILLSADSLAELSSQMLPDVVPLVRDLPGIARDAQGKPLVSAELMVITELKKGVGAQSGSVNVALRGVEPAGLTIRPEVKLVEGRWWQPGLHEIVAGVQAKQQFQGINVGQTLRFRGSEWTVVGVFESDGDAHESELWTDANTARGAFGRPGASSVLAQLEMPGGLDKLKAAIGADPRFRFDVQTERHYFEAQSQNFTQQIGILTTVVAAIMAIGALFGALNTMYSAVSTRQVEIATLRAIGFSGFPVVVSVLAEAVALAVSGGLIGALVAFLLFNGLTVSTLGQNFTQIAFSFVVTPDLVESGLTWAVTIGFLGGLLPAVRVAGPFLWRYKVVTVTLLVAGAIMTLALGITADPAKTIERASGTLLVGGLWIGLGYLALRAIVRRRVAGGLATRAPRLGLTLLAIVPGLALLGPIVTTYVLRALWAADPAELAEDPIIAGLRRG
jgi:putative ABC transport system permease protein